MGTPAAQTPLASLFTWAWLVPLLPLLAFATISLVPLVRRNRVMSAAVAIGMLLAATVIAWGILIAVTVAGEPAGEGGEIFRQRMRWAPIGSSTLTVGYRIDGPAALMAAMVTLVSLCIHLFSIGYMAHDEHPAGRQRQSRFFSFLALFTAAMLTTVLADDLLVFFIGWELMGLCSYLLIGFWYFRPAAVAAARKAFITTRIGDVGFLLALVALSNAAGSLTFGTGPGEIFNRAVLERMSSWSSPLGFSLATAVALLLLLGAAGKSAQLPLHVWLPDAMEGPTPVSALIHAATMVAAGVFLIVRTYPIFAASAALPVVAIVGASTALVAALIAATQHDIKRILAYSTMSQLGFMFAALGSGAWLAALFHLLTNAFFKALLFLGAGSVIHGMEPIVGHDPARTQDVREMGGLRRVMPWTFWTYLVGALALVGVFPLAGFWSKDEILLETRTAGPAVFLTLLATSFLTAFYMTRQVVLVFFGAFRGQQAPSSLTSRGASVDPLPRESPAVMLIPLVILAMFALGAGFINAGLLDIHWLADVLRAEAPPTDVVVPVTATGVALLGITLGCWLYRGDGTHRSHVDPLRRLIGPVYDLLARRLYIDELYQATVIRLNTWFGHAARWLDDRVVDRLVNLTAPVTFFIGAVAFILDDTLLNDGADQLARRTQQAGDDARRLQSGRVRDYLTVLFVGVLVIALVYVYVL